MIKAVDSADHFVSPIRCSLQGDKLSDPKSQRVAGRMLVMLCCGRFWSMIVRGAVEYLVALFHQLFCFTYENGTYHKRSTKRNTENHGG